MFSQRFDVCDILFAFGLPIEFALTPASASALGRKKHNYHDDHDDDDGDDDCDHAGTDNDDSDNDNDTDWSALSPWDLGQVEAALRSGVLLCRLVDLLVPDARLCSLLKECQSDSTATAALTAVPFMAALPNSKSSLPLPVPSISASSASSSPSPSPSSLPLSSSSLPLPLSSSYISPVSLTERALAVLRQRCPTVNARHLFAARLLHSSSSSSSSSNLASSSTIIDGSESLSTTAWWELLEDIIEVCACIQTYRDLE